MLSVRVRYHPKGGPFDLAVRILGIRLGGRKKSTEDTEGDMKLRDRNGEEDGNEDSDIEFGEEQLLELLEEGLENADSPSEETAEGTTEDPETSAKPEEETAEWSETAKADESHAEPNAEAESFDMGEAFESEKETSSLADRIGKLIDKIRRVFQNIPEKIEKLKQSVEKLAEKKNSLMELIQDADNQSLFRLLWKQTGGVFHVDGEGLPHLVMKGGGSAHPATQQTLDEGWHYLYQEGRAVYKHAVTDMLNSSMEVAERNNINVADVDWFIPHQANMRIIEAVAERAGLGHDKVLVNIEHYGNTSAASIPLCIDEYKDKLKKGDKIILTAFGAGFTWGALYVIWDL